MKSKRAMWERIFIQGSGRVGLSVQASRLLGHPWMVFGVFLVAAVQNKTKAKAAVP